MFYASTSTLETQNSIDSKVALNVIIAYELQKVEKM